jgi:hypothetical protein
MPASIREGMIKMETCERCGAASSVTVQTKTIGEDGVPVLLDFCLHHARGFAPTWAEAMYSGMVSWQGSIFPVGPEFWGLWAANGDCELDALVLDEWIPVAVPHFGLTCDECKTTVMAGTVYQNGLETRCYDCSRKPAAAS